MAKFKITMPAWPMILWVICIVMHLIYVDLCGYGILFPAIFQGIEVILCLCLLIRLKVTNNE